MIRLESSEFDLLRLLSVMFVFRAYIYMQVAEYFTSQRILRQHAAYSILNKCKRLALELLFRRSDTLTAWVTRISDVLFAVPLVTCQNNFLCVYYNYVVAAVRVWRKVGLVLPA